MENNPYPVAQNNRPLTLLAWAVVVLISALPDIFFSEIVHRVPKWLPYLKMALLALLMLASFLIKSIHPLRKFLWVGS